MKKLTSCGLLALLLSLPVYAEQEVNNAVEQTVTAEVTEAEQAPNEGVAPLDNIEPLPTTSETQQADAQPPQDLSPWGMYQSRSEEHTSELQSRGHLVCRLLLEKKNKQHYKYE